MHALFHNANGLTTHGAEPQSFEVAGVDDRFILRRRKDLRQYHHRRQPRGPGTTLRPYALPNFPANNLTYDKDSPSTITSYPVP